MVGVRLKLCHVCNNRLRLRTLLLHCYFKLDLHLPE